MGSVINLTESNLIGWSDYKFLTVWVMVGSHTLGK